MTNLSTITSMDRHVNKKEFHVKIAYLLVVFYLCYLFVNSENRPDYDMYKYIYDGIYPEHERGYILINNFFRILGFSYKQFLAIISAIGFIILYRFFIKRCFMPYAILITYIWFPFVQDGIQIRSYLANIVLIYTSQYIMIEKKGNIAKYIFFVLLATSFHYYAIIYLALLFSRIRFNKKQLTYLILIMSIFAIVLYRETTVISSLISAIFGVGSKVASNFYQERRLGFIIPIIMQGLNFLLFRRSYLANKTNEIFLSDELSNEKVPLDRRRDKMTSMDSIDILYKANIIMMLALFPFYTYTVDFFRVYRAMFIINAIFIFNTIYLKNGRLGNKGTISLYELKFLIYTILLGIINGHHRLIFKWFE